MTLEEITNELQLNDEQTEILKKFQQSTEDRVRTNYSEKIKVLESELKKNKPVELTEEQQTIKELKKELQKERFNNQLKGLGVSDDMAQFLKTDLDLDKFKDFYSNLKANSGSNDYVPTNNQNEGAGITKEQFTNMNYEQKAELYQESPELYAQLSRL